jgi:hypothetical protein
MRQSYTGGYDYRLIVSAVCGQKLSCFSQYSLEAAFFFQLNALCIPLFESVLCEAIWPGADGVIRIFTFPYLVIIIHCKETAQTGIGRAMQSASTKSQ